MQIEWYGQSAFALRGEQVTVAIDPFGDVSGFAARGLTFEYPPIAGLEAELLLVTHEHRDHNGVEAVGGDPQVVRSTAGRFEAPAGEVLAVASEHDEVAGTQRGPTTAPSASTSSSRRTSSSAASITSPGSRSRASRWTRCRTSARSPSCPQRLRADDREQHRPVQHNAASPVPLERLLRRLRGALRP
jgi:Beta-lactamase superfamily domain